MFRLLLALLTAFPGLLRRSAGLRIENLALRHWLALLRKQAPRRVRLGGVDRLLWVLLARCWPRWRGALAIVRPETVLSWHRQGFRLFWRRKSRRGNPGRRRIAYLAVTAHPTAERTAQQLTEAFPWETAPHFLLRDRDGIYTGKAFTRRVAALGIDELPTAPRSASGTCCACFGAT
jgi:hypothetical protein